MVPSSSPSSPFSWTVSTQSEVPAHGLSTVYRFLACSNSLCYILLRVVLFAHFEFLDKVKQ